MPSAASNTVYGIINDAMHDAGFLQEGQTPNSQQLSDNMRRLCDIINFEQTQGLKLFLLEDIEVNLVAGQAEYLFQPTLGTIDMDKPLRVLQAYMLNTNGLAKRPMTALSWNEWINLSQTAGNIGAISSYFVNKQAYSLKVSFWLTPDIAEALNTAHLLMQVQAPNPVNLTDDVSFPQEWRMFLRWALADDIATGQPQAIMDRCSQRTQAYREMLEDWDVEDTSTRFAIDMRSSTGVGSFS